MTTERKVMAERKATAAALLSYEEEKQKYLGLREEFLWALAPYVQHIPKAQGPLGTTDIDTLPFDTLVTRLTSLNEDMKKSTEESRRSFSLLRYLGFLPRS